MDIFSFSKRFLIFMMASSWAFKKSSSFWNFIQNLKIKLKEELLILYNRQNEMSKISKRNVQKKEKRPS